VIGFAVCRTPWDQWLFTTTYKDCETDGKYKEQELKSKPRRVRVINLGATSTN